MTRSLLRVSAALAAVGAACSVQFAFAQVQDIPIGLRIHPESIATTPSGGLLIGSFAQNAVYRWEVGEPTAQLWLSEGFEPEGNVLGVFASGDNAYVCINGPFGSNIARVGIFSLATAAQLDSIPFPDGGSCNDFAMASDGTLYVTDTSEVGRILALAPGEREFRVVASGADISGIDGLAFLDGALYANDYLSGKFYRVDLVTGTYEALELSRELLAPDGMRTTLDGAGILVAESNGGRVARLSIQGNQVEVADIANGLISPTGVAQLGDIVFVVEARWDAIAPGAADPGVFSVRAISLVGPADTTAVPVAPVTPPSAAR